MSGSFHSNKMPSYDKCLLKGPIGIFWDIENCAVPSDVLPEDVAGNIRTALQNNSMIEGEVTLFSAFADLMTFSKRFRECFYRTGVKIVDVPNNRKEAADKAILVDMFLFALDNRPPSSIMLISGDADFAPTLHILGQRGYNVILVIPTGVCVSPALQNAGRFVWDWPSLAHGKGFVTPCSIPAKMMRSPVKGSVGSQVEEPNSLSECSSSDSTATFHSYETSQSAKISSSSPETSARTRPSSDKGDMANLQPGDINDLKFQLVKLLELSGGCLSLSHIPKEYATLFQRPLIFSEYGGERLIHLLEHLSDVISIRGNTDNKEAFLAVSTPKKDGKWKKAGMPSCSLGMSLLPGDMNGLRCQLVKLLKLSGGCLSLNQFQQEYARLFQKPLILSEYGATRLISLLEKLPDVIAIGGQSDNRVAYLHQSVSEASSFLPETSNQPGDLNDLKRRLIKLLKTSGGHLLLSRIPEEYEKLFQQPLDVSKFGATKLITLLEKLSDAITIRGEGGMRTARLRQSASPRLEEDPKTPPACNKVSDLNALKRRLTKLLKMSSGHLLLSRIPEEYEKVFQQPLDVSKYGAAKLITLLEKLSDAIAIRGEDGMITARLRQSASPRLEEDPKTPPACNKKVSDLNALKRRLTKLLKMSSGHLLLSRIPEEYEKLFQQPLDVSKFGATKLISLLEKLSDVIIIGGEGGMLTAYLLQ